MNQSHSGRLRSLPLKRFCALYLLLLILFATSISDSQSTDATISGLVVDPSGNVIADADIEILNADTGVHYSTKTNGSGIYMGLPPRLTQTVKTLFAVRCKILDRQDHCNAF
jgi:hypothetical protein